MPFVIDIDPIAFSLAGIDIRWYGLLLVAAITVAYAVAQREAKRRSLPPEAVADTALWRLWLFTPQRARHPRVTPVSQEVAKS